MSETELKAEIENATAALEADLQKVVKRIKTPARIAWYMAVVIGLVCALFGFILGRAV